MTLRRTLALVWQPSPDRDVVARDMLAKFFAQRPSWTRLAELPGLVVCSTGDHTDATNVYTLHGRGVVVGNLFSRSYVDDYEEGGDAPEPIAFDLAQSEQIATSQGRKLTTSFWGRYLAFLVDPSASRRVVLRDPGGAMPCYYTSHRDVEIFVSDIGDCEPLELPRFTINWQHLGNYLHFEYTQTAETGLREVRTLLPGEARIVSSHGLRARFIWSAVDVASRGAIEDATLAATELRRTVTACIAAWSSLHEHVVHRLSGGLDSTLILAALAAAKRARVTALHFTSDVVDSEERRYARLAAEHAGVELIEKRVVDADYGATQRARIPSTALPMSHYYGLGGAAADADLASDIEAGAFTSGHGGDEVLGASSGQYGAIDYLRRHRPGRQLLPVAMDAAILQRESLWSVLYHALRAGTLRGEVNPFDALTGSPSSALSAALRASLSIEDIAHPLLADARLPPGKLLHLFAIATPYMNVTLAPHADAVEQIHPFHSQPIVELCLGIPTYRLGIGGRNRGLARNAFLGLAETTVLSRNAKGSGDLHYNRFARSHDRQILGHLRSGVLAGHGLLDVAHLEAMVDGDHAELHTDLSQLLTFFEVEDWAQRWASSS